MVFVITGILPLMLFLGGAYLLGYPLSLGVLYGINVGLMSVIILVVINQVIQVLSQRIEVLAGEVILTRKQLCSSIPIIRQFSLEVPIDTLRYLQLQATRVGYLLTVKFDQDDKTMGLDLELNPLANDNKRIINQILELNKNVEVDDNTIEILEAFDHKKNSWKATYLVSVLLLVLALAIFFAISVYLGAKAA